MFMKPKIPPKTGAALRQAKGIYKVQRGYVIKGDLHTKAHGIGGKGPYAPIGQYAPIGFSSLTFV
jgi:hypothetical protein